MKTSNKLLITFAAALILVPLLGMIYISQVNYKYGEYKDEVRTVENFSTPTADFTSYPLREAFGTISIEGAKHTGINIQYVKDDKFGVKFSNSLKGLIDFKTGANGQLHIRLNAADVNNDNRYLSLIIYAPVWYGLELADAEWLNLDASLDSLHLDIKNIGNVSLREQLKIRHLNVAAENVKGFELRNLEIQSIALALKQTNFTSRKNSFGNVSLNMNSESTADFKGDSGEAGKYTIGKLVLNTQGKTSVIVDGIKVADCAGTLSDQTMVQMPAINLKQLYQK